MRSGRMPGFGLPKMKVDFDKQNSEGWVAASEAYAFEDLDIFTRVIAHDKSGAKYYGTIAGYEEGAFYVELDEPVPFEDLIDDREEGLNMHELIESLCDAVGTENVFIINTPQDARDIAKMLTERGEYE